LVDLIRSGKAPEVIRRKGAEGKLPLPAEDTLEILTLLATGGEADLREKALETLRQWDATEMRRVLADPQTVPEVLHFAAQELAPNREEVREVLLCNPGLPLEARSLLQSGPAFDSMAVKGSTSAPGAAEAQPTPSTPLSDAVQAFDDTGDVAAQPEEATIETLARLAAGEPLEDVAGAQADVPPEVTKRDDELTQNDRETLIQKIARMAVVQKIKAALTGNLETRSLLIRDANKLVSRAVLQSPRISETEAESYAAAKNVSEEVLRLIAANRKFMKMYVVMRALANNPRAPIDITLPLLPRLNPKDLKGLSQNRNIPDVIRSMGLKLMKQKEDALKPKLGGKH
jgi:hypothetical protein